ncbi:MAG: hypothetical protein RL380_1255 [Verrucomicrobiota bacterium]|jgi:tetratricopeptide (TPR) repeat protein
MISRAILYSPAALCALLFALAAPLRAQSTTPGFRYAETNFFAARREFLAAPTNMAAATRLATASFDRAEFATNDTERAMLAVAAINPLRELLARHPKTAAAHYYLAMNLGQLARTKTLGALKLVDEMEIEFKAALALDPHLDHAGPDRNLGQLYFQAPGWPASVGSHSKARKHLERAVELAPDFPDNHLCLLEAAGSWRDKKILQREFAALKTNWPSAQTNFTGAAWESSWADWGKRRRTLVSDASGN